MALAGRLRSWLRVVGLVPALLLGGEVHPEQCQRLHGIGAEGYWASHRRHQQCMPWPWMGGKLRMQRSAVQHLRKPELSSVCAFSPCHTTLTTVCAAAVAGVDIRRDLLRLLLCVQLVLLAVLALHACERCSCTAAANTL